MTTLFTSKLSLLKKERSIHRNGENVNHEKKSLYTNNFHKKHNANNCSNDRYASQSDMRFNYLPQSSMLRKNKGMKLDCHKSNYSNESVDTSSIIGELSLNNQETAGRITPTTNITTATNNSAQKYQQQKQQRPLQKFQHLHKTHQTNNEILMMKEGNRQRFHSFRSLNRTDLSDTELISKERKINDKENSTMKTKPNFIPVPSTYFDMKSRTNRTLSVDKYNEKNMIHSSADIFSKGDNHTIMLQMTMKEKKLLDFVSTLSKVLSTRAKRATEFLSILQNEEKKLQENREKIIEDFDSLITSIKRRKVEILEEFDGKTKYTSWNNSFKYWNESENKSNKSQEYSNGEKMRTLEKTKFSTPQMSRSLMSEKRKYNNFSNYEDILLYSKQLKKSSNNGDEEEDDDIDSLLTSSFISSTTATTSPTASTSSEEMNVNLIDEKNQILNVEENEHVNYEKLREDLHNEVRKSTNLLKETLNIIKDSKNTTEEQIDNEHIKQLIGREKRLRSYFTLLSVVNDKNDKLIKSNEKCFMVTNHKEIIKEIDKLGLLSINHAIKKIQPIVNIFPTNNYATIVSDKKSTWKEKSDYSDFIVESNGKSNKLKKEVTFKNDDYSKKYQEDLKWKEKNEKKSLELHIEEKPSQKETEICYAEPNKLTENKTAISSTVSLSTTAPSLVSNSDYDYAPDDMSVNSSCSYMNCDEGITVKWWLSRKDYSTLQQILKYAGHEQISEKNVPAYQLPYTYKNIYEGLSNSCILHDIPNMNNIYVMVQLCIGDYQSNDSKWVNLKRDH
ncbi:hypothetical protein SNEBB_000821 [Seison nebaliae]|nr:hypothetical protein SNEBB_000821 [Seison nebaliae]